MSLYLKYNNQQFRVGDTVKIHQKITEAEKTRTQIFEGLIIKIKGHQDEKTITVRKISQGIGVEKIFPIDSPFIKKIVLSKKGNPKRSKLYYLRNRTGRQALKVKEIFDTNITNGKKSIQKKSGKNRRNADKKKASEK